VSKELAGAVVSAGEAVAGGAAAALDKWVSPGGLLSRGGLTSLDAMASSGGVGGGWPAPFTATLPAPVH
ncbi:MAG: hypothetical protein ACKOJF_22690, partial [Planctomycetaceae bacterium]